MMEYKNYLAAAAATDGVSLNSWIVQALEERTSG